MKHKFGWDLPPGVTNRMIEEQAGAFEEEEYRYLKFWPHLWGRPTVAERNAWNNDPHALLKVIITREDDFALYVLGDDGLRPYPKGDYLEVVFT